MKVKATKQEIRECVANALVRVISEGKSDRMDNKFQKNFEHKKRDPKHCQLGNCKQKGNKGNNRYMDDEDAY